MLQTRAKRVQSALNAHGTYSGRISHTPETRPAFIKFLSMFKKNCEPKRARNAQRRLVMYSDARRTYIKRTKRACFERVFDVRLAYVKFCYFFNTPGARFTYTLLCDCCLKLVLTSIIGHCLSFVYLFSLQFCTNLEPVFLNYAFLLSGQENTVRLKA